MASSGRAEPRAGPGSTAVAECSDRFVTLEVTRPRFLVMANSEKSLTVSPAPGVHSPPVPGSTPIKQLGDLPDFLTVEEAAAVLRIGRTSAYVLCQRWRYTGGRAGLPVVRIGRLLRVPRAALERLAATDGDAA